jgi:hypothetical protein
MGAMGWRYSGKARAWQALSEVSDLQFSQPFIRRRDKSKSINYSFLGG